MMTTKPTAHRRPTPRLRNVLVLGEGKTAEMLVRSLAANGMVCSRAASTDPPRALRELKPALVVFVADDGQPAIHPEVDAALHRLPVVVYGEAELRATGRFTAWSLCGWVDPVLGGGLGRLLYVVVEHLSASDAKD